MGYILGALTLAKPSISVPSLPPVPTSPFSVAPKQTSYTAQPAQPVYTPPPAPTPQVQTYVSPKPTLTLLTTRPPVTTIKPSPFADPPKPVQSDGTPGPAPTVTTMQDPSGQTVPATEIHTDTISVTPGADMGLMQTMSAPAASSNKMLYAGAAVVALGVAYMFMKKNK